MSASNTECGREGKNDENKILTNAGGLKINKIPFPCPRAPLNPDQVRHLIEEHNFRVIVQPSSLRIFSNDEYIDAGATLSEDLSDACLILGIKKMSPASIQPGKSYMFFGHVIKAQKSNFDILDKLLESKVSKTCCCGI